MRNYTARCPDSHLIVMGFRQGGSVMLDVLGGGGGDGTVDVEYGRRVANALAGFDVGQSVAICDRACVAVEAMEGTDVMLRRAAGLVNGRRMALVKVARRREHLLFDVPVVGLETVAVMKETGTTVLSVEAGRTLMLDKDE